MPNRGTLREEFSFKKLDRVYDAGFSH